MVDIGDGRSHYVLDQLRERAKELNCLYRIEELTNDPEQDVEVVIRGILRAIPPGWQFVNICEAMITFDGQEFKTSDSIPTPWVQEADLKVHDQVLGSVKVFYTREMPAADEGPFLKEERKLITTIADRLGHFILHQQLRQMVGDWNQAHERLNEDKTVEWKIVVDLLRRTDKDLYLGIARKMLNYLCWHGIHEADALLEKLSADEKSETLNGGGNRPMQRKRIEIMDLSEDIFKIAGKTLPDEEILQVVQRWMHEDKSSFFSRTLVNLDSSLGDLADALRRFHHLMQQGVELSPSAAKGARVHLTRRFLSDHLEFIRIAKDYVDIEDFVDLIPRLIHPPNSHGKLGGKGSGLFLAYRMLTKFSKEKPELKNIKTPKTWYITSDGLHSFMNHNNLGEVTEQKYKEIGLVRQEYPHIIQLFKNSRFTPEMVQGLSMALDDFGDVPLIVRSSSLLEDRLGTAFSGKYVSLFLANRGTKWERLEALMDAIAEVYASTFGADPIEYRAERGLIDFHEEMGVLIQEVVGKPVGKYYVPMYAGVAFSSNEFRWSPRIKRDDGLVRLVPGLGTRAVDRLSDDYPILLAPGQPGLRVNASVDEIIRYAPNKMDVINLETNNFETVDIKEFLKTFGDEFPNVDKVVSVVKDNHISLKNQFNLDFEDDEVVVTFEGLVTKTNFIAEIKSILDALEEGMGYPVDIEFAHDGRSFYLLQCRPQSYSMESKPAPIPKDIPETSIVFSANKYVSNGIVPDITHVVYVDPQMYSEVENLKTLRDIGKAIGELNKQLPKRQFILIGPGRWGSRGDIKLGVDVTYSQINNTAMLIEVAMAKGNYVPDLSFGTHFFQDLVEASIRYLPLYPGEKNVHFNKMFLTRSENVLSEILPEFNELSEVIRVIDIGRVTDGKVLKVFMNADLDEAVAILSTPGGTQVETMASTSKKPPFSDDHWKWRLRMAHRIAEQLDGVEYGVKAFFVFGSTKNGTAGPGSDIDVLLHISEDEEKRHNLMLWLDGWSQCLDEMNFLRTGYHSKGLLDVHLVTDADIKNRTSFAAKIGAVTDAARELPMKRNYKQ